MLPGLERQIYEIACDFDRDPFRSSRQLRALIQERWATFPHAAVRRAIAEPKCRASRFLISLLASQDRLIDQIASVTTSLEQGKRLGSLAIDVAPGIERRCLEEICQVGSRLSHAQKERLMAVIGSIAEASLLVRELTRVMEEGPPHLRSKAALLLGRARRDAEWLNRLQDEPDERVRANAIESLWLRRDPRIAEVLLTAAEDRNNRVAGNAAYGLYRLGSPRSLPIIAGMLRHPESSFRLTGTWLAAQTADPRFLVQVRGLAEDPDLMVREKAAEAAIAIEEKRREVLARDRLFVAAAQEAAGEDPWLARVRVLGMDGAPLSGLNATDFQLWMGHEPLLSYVSTAIDPPPKRTFAWIVFWEKETGALLHQHANQWPKPAGETHHWLTVSSGGILSCLTSELPKLAQKVSRLTVDYATGEGLKLDISEGEAAEPPLRQVLPPLLRLGGDVHIVVVWTQPGPPAADSLRRLLPIRRIWRVHGIATLDAPALRALCEQAKGNFVHTNMAVLQGACSDTLTAVCANYDLRYESVESAKVEIFCDAGYGNAQGQGELAAQDPGGAS